MALSGALGLGLVARDARDAAAVCVAGVAQSHIHLRTFVLCGRRGTIQSHWQGWHNRTSTFVSRGKRGAISHPPSFRVAGVALMALSGALGLGLVARDAHDAAACCVAGVAQSHIHLRFAWHVWRNFIGRRDTTAHHLRFTWQ